MYQQTNQFSSANTTELKLDYQPSITSLINESSPQQLNGGSSSIYPENGGASNGSTNGGANGELLIDTEEGLRKYTKKVYSDIIEVIQSVVVVPQANPFSIDNIDFDDKGSIEEMKGYHQK